MKYDLNKKMTKFAERVLTDLSETLFALLQEKSLENITVNEICEITNYPRATFYNYFDDIFDLMNYCWRRMADNIIINDYETLEPESRTFILFDRCYTYLSGYEEMIREIIRHNDIDGRCVESLRNYIRFQIYTIIIGSPCSDKYAVPKELIAEHYSNTIQMVLSWCFLRKERLSKEQAMETLHYLLGGL